jgi:hypothetical protein
LGIRRFLELKLRGKLTALTPAAAIETASFFVHVFEDLGPGKRWQPRRDQHTIDDPR